MATLCNICKKEKAIIHISGVGDFCLACHNQRMLERSGLEDTFQYAENMSVMEPSGEIHTFKVEHMIMGDIVCWEAREQNGNYHFREISSINDNGTVDARKFFRKIVNGVLTKSLEICGFQTSNSLWMDDMSYALKEKGTINIIENKSGSDQVNFEVDGKVFTPEQFGKLLASYPGFSMQYQIHDGSDPILKEDEYLVPVKITKQSLVEELEMAIASHGDGYNFISNEAMMTFDEAFYNIVHKLEVLAATNKREDALEAARQMAKIMAAVETDDDYFPEYNLECICRAADPHGLDEELAAIMQEFYEGFE